VGFDALTVLAYRVSRFPVASQTLILRELNGVVERGMDVSLPSLIPALGHCTDPAAGRWLQQMH